MEQKTKVMAEEGRQDLVITRTFDLPVALLFKAHTDAEIFSEWMSHEYGIAKVVKFEIRKHGAWQFDTVDAQGNVMFSAAGTIHDVVPDKKITRTFEMSNNLFDTQLEFLDFEALPEEKSKLTMHLVFRSVEQRDQLLKMPFAQGLHMAHNRLQEIAGKLK